MILTSKHTDFSTLYNSLYRYGYQGSESDSEVKGEGNSYTTEYRQLDPRLGRWLTIDPLASKYPGMSPYTSMNNNPITTNDKLGLEGTDWIKRKGSDSWEYDSGILNEKEAIGRYGEGTEFKYNGDSYEGKSGGSDVGSIRLNSGGLQTWEGGAYQNEDINPFGNVPSTQLPSDQLNRTSDIDMSTYYNLPKPKSGIQQMIDEAYNKGNYSKAFVYWLNDKEQSYDGRDGLKNASNDFLGKGGEMIAYLGPYGRFVGTVFSVVNVSVQTSYNYNDFGTEAALKTATFGAISTFAPSQISKKLPFSSKMNGLIEAGSGSILNKGSDKLTLPFNKY